MLLLMRRHAGLSSVGKFNAFIASAGHIGGLVGVATIKRTWVSGIVGWKGRLDAVARWDECSKYMRRQETSKSAQQG